MRLWAARRRARTDSRWGEWVPYSGSKPFGPPFWRSSHRWHVRPVRPLCAPWRLGRHVHGVPARAPLRVHDMVRRRLLRTPSVRDTCHDAAGLVVLLRGHLNRHRHVLPLPAGVIVAANSTLGVPVPSGPFYPMGTVALPLSLVDQFGAPYALCDVAVWATESPGVAIVLSGSTNISAMLSCPGPGAADVAVVVTAGWEAEPGSLTLSVMVAGAHVGGSPTVLTINAGLSSRSVNAGVVSFLRGRLPPRAAAGICDGRK